ncbi:MAG: hypothetical protein LBT21_05900 [Oscillospiraceae bacterium]|nr:hypothetical protein [Oscillospiraceae bacterium]
MLGLVCGDGMLLAFDAGIHSVKLRCNEKYGFEETGKKEEGEDEQQGI